MSPGPYEKATTKHPPGPSGDRIFMHGMGVRAGSDSWKTIVFAVSTFLRLVHALVMGS